MFGWVLTQGIKNIARNKLISLISVLTMSVSIFLFSLFLVIFLNFESTIKYIEKDICITVFFEEKADADDIRKIGEDILLNENVDRIDYISSTNAWEDFLGDYFEGDEEIKDLFKEDNPLKYSSSYTVYLKDVTKQSETSAYIKNIDMVRQVNEATKIAELFRDLRAMVSFITVFIMSVLVTVSIFLIGSTITQGIFRRKNEIRIMKFCGATELMIRGQFLVEGLFIGVIGSLLPLAVLIVLYNKATTYMLEHYIVISRYLNLKTMESMFKYLAPSVLIMGIGIGYIGSRIAMSRYLKV